jgi:hypothetical protein
MRAPSTIEVRCYGPGHVRGKVAMIAVFDRDEDGCWRDRRLRSRKRPHYDRSDSPTSYRCKLCRREVPGWADQSRVLNPVLDRLAAAGRFEVPFAEFVELASSHRSV